MSRIAGLALTFDDGPDPAGTPAVLDALADAGARGTFFCVGPLAERHPGLVRDILAAGHVVGVHCDEHVRQDERDPAWAARDLGAALRRLRAAGAAPSLWRTPWGVQAHWTTALARRAGLRLVGWSVDTHDWRGDSAERMLAATADRARDGAIVLAHDGIGPGALRRDARETARWVSMTAALAADRGLGLVALS